MKVIHNHSIFYQFSKPAFAFVSDLSWEYDNIAEANEIISPMYMVNQKAISNGFQDVYGVLSLRLEFWTILKRYQLTVTNLLILQMLKLNPLMNL